MNGSTAGKEYLDGILFVCKGKAIIGDRAEVRRMYADEGLDKTEV